MNDIIGQRLEECQCQNDQEERNAVKEITQEVALYALFNANFFEAAGFQGGTALRVLYGLNRFSEDLDFSLIKASNDFNLIPYMDKTVSSMSAYGYDIRVTGKDEEKTVKSRFLKEDSIGNIVTFHHIKNFRGSISIKVEVDINPPGGAMFETKYHDFPLDFPIRTLNKSSLFASKSHALLCREYIKGRDWYDFSWYVSRKVGINFDLFSSAIDQIGPWKDKKIKIDKKWYMKNMAERIKSVNWEEAKRDIERFLRPDDLKVLQLWTVDFFMSKLDKLDQYL